MIQIGNEINLFSIWTLKKGSDNSIQYQYGISEFFRKHQTSPLILLFIDFVHSCIARSSLLPCIECFIAKYSCFILIVFVNIH
jgi:hypothetical protein